MKLLLLTVSAIAVFNADSHGFAGGHKERNSLKRDMVPDSPNLPKNLEKLLYDGPGSDDIISQTSDLKQTPLSVLHGSQDRKLPAEVAQQIEKEYLKMTSTNGSYFDESKGQTKTTRQSCGGVYNYFPGAISHPPSGGDYQNNENCIWIVRAPGRMNIKFFRFDIEKRFDYLFIRDGDSSESNLIGMYDGNNSPKAIQTTSNAVYLHFTSDTSVTRPGFYIYWEPLDSHCIDKSLNCQSWEAAGYCDTSATWMPGKCPVSCNKCDSICIDKYSGCQDWAAKGACECNPDWMLSNCPVTCDQCDSHCFDKSANCNGYAAVGYCEKYPNWMLPLCPVSCNQCDSLCLDCDLRCQSLAAKGECATNPDWMLPNCPLSCNQCGLSLDTCVCGTVNRFKKIINGNTTEENEYPWQVALVRQGSNRVYCGGSLINDRWVLTAAHCTQSGVAQVLLGNHFQSQIDSTEMRVNITRVINHPNYNGQNLDNDFALLELAAPLNLEAVAPHIQPVCLPSATNPSQYEDVDAIVTGWGTTSNGAADTLQEVTVRTMSNSKCNEKLSGRHSVFSSNICASKPGKGHCFGDSGGPLVKNVGSYFNLIGVVSWVVGGCAHPEYPSGYGRVTDAINWITSNSIGKTCAPPN